MASIIPQSELVKKAVAWIDEHVQTNEKSLLRIIDEAAARFNLSPKDVEFLTRFYQQQEQN